MAQGFDTVLKGGRVIDPSQSINAVNDVAIKDGKIAAVGKDLDTTGAEVVDVAGTIVTPGLVDIHVHVYGILGFAWPDRVGITQGVTTFVEPGGPGVATYPEYKALTRGTNITNLYCGTYVSPPGITGLEVVDGDIRALVDIPICEWLDLVEANRDDIRYLKVGAFSNYGAGVVKLGKGMADILGLPLYIHIGDFMKSYKETTTPTAFNMAEKGDMVTHIYHSNPGSILDDTGRVRPEVYAAEKRGVIFDVGYGAYNFSFVTAEKALPQGIIPHVISSDLQQVNVTGPCYSLANVMSMFLKLGLTPEEIIERVTINAARSMGFEDRHGTLHVGRAADVSVLKIEEGEFEFGDTQGNKRQHNQRFMPVMVFKDGRRHEIDMEIAQEYNNWSMEIATDHVPEAAAHLSGVQKDFLRELGRAIADVKWEAKEFNTVFVDMKKAMEIHRHFHATQQTIGLPLKDALLALMACVFDSPFTYQAGVVIVRQPRAFMMERLAAVANGHAQAAA
ncbi:MAG TPA: amidohydrolase family protein [Candidatus Binataceae bacterium]|nr:amidohydrolase family protein [Candidatus Binataceae bacterium]